MPVPAYQNQQLFDALQELEVIDPSELQQAYTQAQDNNVPIDQILLDKNLISDLNLGKLIADILNLPFVSLEDVKIDPETIKLIPESLSRKYFIIAYHKDEEKLQVATSYPNQPDILQFLAQKYNLPVHVHYATVHDIRRVWQVYKADLSQEIATLEPSDQPNFTKQRSVAKLIDMLLENAYASRASDIHIEPQKEASLIRYRIDGQLHDVVTLPFDMHDQIISRIKVLSRLRTDEHFAPQDGKMHTEFDQESIDVRVSIAPVIIGEKAVLRILSSNNRHFSLNDLGMTQEDLDVVKSGFKKSFGMVLSTGPTGSGKTTSIYSILKIINSRDRNISTIEDPDEYRIPGINQMIVNQKTGFTFANGLRSILRQDPDVIFVGEIRDSETAQIATNAALTGHLVLSTLHTNDAATTVPRMIDMGVEPFLIASTINVVIAQRLIRRVCESCRYSRSVNPKEIETLISKKLIAKYFSGQKEIQLYQGKGCPVCRETGLAGRVGIFEVMNIDEKIRNLIMKRANADEIKNQAIKSGMTPMLEDGLRKVRLGITTLEEIVRGTKA